MASANLGAPPVLPRFPPQQILSHGVGRQCCNFRHSQKKGSFSMIRNSFSTPAQIKKTIQPLTVLKMTEFVPSISVEYAKSNRAKCRVCKNSIPAGAIRVGKQYSPDHSGEVKYHLSCFKPTGEKTAKDELFGFERLKPSDQGKVDQRWAKFLKNEQCSDKAGRKEEELYTGMSNLSVTSAPATSDSTTAPQSPPRSQVSGGVHATPSKWEASSLASPFASNANSSSPSGPFGNFGGFSTSTTNAKTPSTASFTVSPACSQSPFTSTQPTTASRKLVFDQPAPSDTSTISNPFLNSLDGYNGSMDASFLGSSMGSSMLNSSEAKGPLESRIDNYVGLSMLTEDQAKWLVTDAQQIPDAKSILDAAIEMYQIDNDREEFVDTIQRLVRMYRD